MQKDRATAGRIVYISGALVALSGVVSCKPSLDDLTVWKAVIPSPDGKWVATASTVQNGGFGSASIDTVVDLARAGAGDPVTMLHLSCEGPMPHPYVLDNSANAGGSVHLSVRWLDPSHLHVSYDSHPEVVFQALRLGPVYLSVDDRSNAAPRG